MFFAVSMLSMHGKISPVKVEDNKLNTVGRICVAAIITDAFISLTALVIGILSVASSLYGLPPATAYTLISLSGVIILSWIALIAHTRGKALTAIFDECDKIQYTYKLALHTTSLVDDQEVERLNLSEMVHELCEINLDGSHRACRFERAQEIVNDLKGNNCLHVLNSIPTNLIQGQYQSQKQLLTPLQYWAGQGNLKITQLLVEHGAMDYCAADPNGFGNSVSALYMATRNGHLDVVNYLLSQGATPCVAFHNIVLLSFIPKLIFNLSSLSKNSVENTLSCLERIFAHLKEKDPENLKLQLQIPVDSERRQSYNVLEWVQADWSLRRVVLPLAEFHPIKMPLVTLLKRFGAKEGDCLSVGQLRALGHDVGSGNTLGEIASLKL